MSIRTPRRALLNLLPAAVVLATLLYLLRQHPLASNNAGDSANPSQSTTDPATTRSVGVSSTDATKDSYPCGRPLVPNERGRCLFHSQHNPPCKQDRHVFKWLGGVVDEESCEHRQDPSHPCKTSQFSQHMVECDCTAPNASAFGRRFLEIGAADGLYLSNSAFYEFQMGWSGVCVEGSPVSFRELAKNRPGCHAVNALVGNELVDRNTSFFTFEKNKSWEVGLSGMEGSQHGKMLKSLESAEAYAKSIGAVLHVDHVPGVLLKDVFVDAGVKNITWGSVDVEGFETEVLETWDFDAVPVDLLSVEGYSGTVRALVTEKWGMRKTTGPQIDSWFERQ